MHFLKVLLFFTANGLVRISSLCILLELGWVSGIEIWMPPLLEFYSFTDHKPNHS